MSAQDLGAQRRREGLARSCLVRRACRVVVQGENDDAPSARSALSTLSRRPSSSRRDGRRLEARRGHPGVRVHEAPVRRARHRGRGACACGRRLASRRTRSKVPSRRQRRGRRGSRGSRSARFLPRRSARGVRARRQALSSATFDRSPVTSTWSSAASIISLTAAFRPPRCTHPPPGFVVHVADQLLRKMSAKVSPEVPT